MQEPEVAAEADHFEIELRGRRFLAAKGYDDAFWQNVKSGTWEDETFTIFDRFIDPKRPYIDLGTWIGPTILYGAQLASVAIGIDADPVAFAELKKNVELNHATNVRIRNVCLGASNGVRRFGSRGKGGDSMSSLLFSEGMTSWEVQGVTFDKLIPEETA